MKLTVKVTKNFNSLQAEMPLLTADDMRQVGLAAREMMLRRTRSGIDQFGRPFAPYSESYRRARAAMGKPAGRVNLELSGAMLGDLQVTDVTPTSVTIGY